MVRRLDDAGIPHMLAGSLAGSFHGEPRSTQDIDLVIDPDTATLERFAASWPRPRYYVGDADTALANRSQFNVIDTATGWKVDLIIRRDRPFSRTEFDRRRPAAVLGVTTHVASAEDTVLAKLEWARDGGSERQLRDVVAILRTSGAGLDEEYLEGWAHVLGVADLLAQARDLLDDA